MQLVHRLDQRKRRAGKADAPTGHGIGLGTAIHGDCAVLQARFHFQNGSWLEAIIGQLFVDIVSEYPHMRMAHQHIRQRLDLGRVIGSAGWVAGVVQDQPLGLGRDRGFQLLTGHFEAGILAALHDHRRAFCQRHNIRVGNPARGGDDRLITRIDRRNQRIKDHLLAAGGDQDFLRRVLNPRVALELGADRAAEFHRAGYIGVFRLPTLNRRNRRVFHIAWGVEIRLPGRQANDILARSLQRARLGGHGNGERGRNTIETIGDELHVGRTFAARAAT